MPIDVFPDITPIQPEPPIDLPDVSNITDRKSDALIEKIRSDFTLQKVNQNLSLLNEKGQASMKSDGTMSSDKSAIGEENRIAKLKDASWEATIVLKGRTDIKLEDKIQLSIYCDDGTLHFTSGTYFVKGITDSIEGSYTTTLKVSRLTGDTGSAEAFSYESGSAYSGVGNYKRSYGCEVPIISGTGAGPDVVRLACQYVGNNYWYGGNNINVPFNLNDPRGIDCSHFVWQILKMTGRDYGYHVSAGWRTIGNEVTPDMAQPGDVLCYNGHVAFYVDSGHIVHAKGRKYGIEVTPCDPFKYHNNVVTIRRVV